MQPSFRDRTWNDFSILRPPRPPSINVLRSLGIADALDLDQACIGVGVTLAALVAQMATPNGEFYQRLFPRSSIPYLSQSSQILSFQYLPNFFVLAVANGRELLDRSLRQEYSLDIDYMESQQPRS